MQETADKLICRGLKYECELGFHDHEQGHKQEISIDFKATVRPIENHADDVSAVQVNYFKANEAITNLLKAKRFNLIETLAVEVADSLLNGFPILDVQVAVTKFPADIPNMGSATYVCRRRKA
ncbi:MAG: hypothetical protein ACD_62C00020G0002 [uncultured bacterium]|nr:MAG: hypothetical protein ACD_62C00020G0002 [uncultured bacterium]